MASFLSRFDERRAKRHTPMPWWIDETVSQYNRWQIGPVYERWLSGSLTDRSLPAKLWT